MKLSLQNDQRGVAHVLVAVLVVVVVAAIGAVGWKVEQNHNKKSSTTTNSTTGTGSSSTVSSSSADTQCLAKYHDADLCKFVAAETAQPIDKTAYQAVMTTSANGTTSTLTFEQDGKGNTSLTTSDGSLDTIDLAGVTYIKTNGVWYKYPASSTPTTDSSSDPNSSLTFTNSLDTTTFTKLDSEACGSLTCLKYKISDSSDTSLGTAYVWFDTKSYLMREFSSTGSSGSLDMKLSYPSVNITAPSPVQDITTAQ